MPQFPVAVSLLPEDVRTLQTPLAVRSLSNPPNVHQCKF